MTFNISKTGRYSRYSRYSRYREGGQGAQILCFCFLDGGAPGLGTWQRGPLSERSKPLRLDAMAQRLDDAAGGAVAGTDLRPPVDVGRGAGRCAKSFGVQIRGDVIVNPGDWEDQGVWAALAHKRWALR